MNKTSFFLGILVGVILTFAGLFVYGLVMNSNNEDPIKYLENPVSYENRTVTSFKVLQVLGNAALATEASDKIGSTTLYHGNTVLILGDNYYSDQIVKIKKPMRIGTYSYTANSGMPMTVPVLDGEIE